ncbi:MAG: DUF359 domain-containing protein [Promethearchaeota archaeon]
MEDNLKLPYEKRRTFAQPLDRLIAGTREETIPKVVELIKKYQEKFSEINCYLVGDIVTQDFLSHAYLKSLVRICIIDEMTQREFVEIDLGSQFEQIIEIQNPTGTIHKSNWQVIEDVINSQKKTVIKVIEGEEDLLVIPLILKLPLLKDGKQLVFYGQPPMTDSKPPIPQGIVCVDVKRIIQKMLNRYVSLMEKV